MKDGVAVPLVWENVDAMVYGKVRLKYFDVRRFGALSSHGRVPRIIYGGRSRATMYGAWQMCQEAWGTVMEGAGEVTDMSVLRDTLVVVYVPDLTKSSRDVDAGLVPKIWLEYRMLHRPYNTMPLLAGSKVCRDAAKFERRYRT